MIHEVQPITSGQRVVLTYNVINDAQSMPLPSATSLGDSSSQLQQVLRQWGHEGAWDDEGNPIDFLCHYLNHEYIESSISLSRLAGKDLQTVTRAAQVAEQTDFSVYLATFEHERSGGCDEDSYGHDFLDEDDVEETWMLQKFVDLKGNYIASSVPISEHQMVDPKALDEEDPDDEDYEGWTGNEGAYSTLWYRRTVCRPTPALHRL